MLHTLFFSSVKTFSRRICSSAFKKSGFVDVNKKIVYGGDLLVPPSEQSFGSILFTRMLRMDRREEVLQICAETGKKFKTREFLQSTVAVAEMMREKGAQKGDFVFLLGNNSINLNIVLIASLFIATVPFPISYRTSIDAFQNILKTIQPKFFWCEKEYLFAYKRVLLESGKIDSSNIFLLDSEWTTDNERFEDFARGRGEDFENFQPTEIENPKKEFALILNAITYGEKGLVVGMTHHNLNSVIAIHDDAGYNVGQRERVSLMVHKVFWISGLYSLFLSCTYGSKLVVSKKFREANFLKNLNEYQVTDVLMFTVKWWRLYKHIPDRQYDLSKCRWAYAINETVRDNLKEAIKEKYGIMLISSYGFTETTGLVFRNEFRYEKGLSVGKLIPETYAKVVSLTTSQAVGPGVVGELCFKGPTITKGYINDKKATQQLFDKDGFLQSGQYGYYDTNGDFYVIDRIDHQIIYKNYKISPKDIEGVIRSLPAVKDVCVAGIPHKRDGAYPIALVVLQKGQKITEDDIITYVSERLPDHKRLRGGVIFVSKILRFRETGAIKRQLLQKMLSKYQMKDDVDALTLSSLKRFEDKK